MRLKWSPPRLLPLTIAAMAALLVVKSVTLVRAATEEGAVPAASGAGGPTAHAATPNGGGAASAAGTAKTVRTRDADAPTAPVQNASAPPVEDAERGVLLDLRHRREALDARAQALDARAAVMQAAQAKLAARVDELAALQARLEAMEAGRQQHQAENWSGLVKVYETMKPRDAAAIFDALDMQVLLAVLDRMQERRVAPILAAMQPDRARLATQMLAEMRLRSTSVASAPDPKS